MLTFEFNIYTFIKRKLGMIISWFKKNECRDPKAIELKFGDVEVVNHGCALMLTINIRNCGYNELNINMIDINLKIGGFPCKLNPSPLDLSIQGGGNFELAVKHVVNTPFLVHIDDLKQKIKTNNEIEVQITSLRLSVSRGRTKHIHDLGDISNRLDWKRNFELSQ